MAVMGPLARETLVARAHLAVALAFIVAAVIELASAPPTTDGLLAAAPMLAMGGFTIAVVGASRFLLSGMAGRALVGPSWLPWAALALLVLGALAARAADGDGGLVARGGTLAWSGALLVHLVVVARSARTPRLRGAPTPKGWRSGEPIVRALQAASLAYGAVAALAMPASYMTGVPRPVAFHLLVTGFVIVTMIAILAHAMPRFTGVAMPAPALGALAALVVPGPALLAAGIASGGAVFVVGASVEGAGLGLFAVAALASLAVSRRQRLPFGAYAAGSVALVAGVTLGIRFAIDPAARMLAPVHGALNVLGFIGLFIVGCSTDFYGPGIVPGARALRWGVATTLALGVGGLVVAVGGAVLEDGAAWRTGLLLYAAGFAVHFLGAVASLVRTRLVFVSAGSSSGSDSNKVV